MSEQDPQATAASHATGADAPEGAQPQADAAAHAQALADLAGIRRSIDNFDAALIHILAERFRCTQRVGELKAAHGLPATDRDRELRQVERLRELARESDLDPEFAEKFLGFVIAEVINHHKRIAGESS